MTTLTEAQMERAARELCKIRGIDPDRCDQFRPMRWFARNEIIAALEVQQAIATAMKEQA